MSYTLCGYLHIKYLGKEELGSVYTYPDSFASDILLRFQNLTFKSLSEHALIKKLRQIPQQRCTWAGNFCASSSSFSKACDYKCPPVFGFVAFLNISILETIFKCLRLQCAFSPNTCGRKA